MTRPTLYLTAREMTEFAKDYDETEVGVYVPRTVEPGELESVRPVVTTRNLIESHYVLEHWTTGEGIGEAAFDYYEEGRKRTKRLDIEIVETHDAIPVTACIDVLRRNHDLDDAAIAAILEEHARDLREEQW